jgi:asparagine synthase (glutamine-hydrolysing)
MGMAMRICSRGAPSGNRHHLLTKATYARCSIIGILGGEMCGIAVAIDWDGAEAAVRHLITGLLHRGDVTDPLVMVGNDVAMCTRRLRIVDPAHGVQPQASFDERYLVSFNGEIYNHVDLRLELEALGVRFRTECDTEVVANVLRVWGSGGIKRMAGMYAFVAFDTAAGEFLAARDPFGVKPLYLIQSTRGFLFCSEIRPLLDATEDDDVLLLSPGFILTRNFCGRHYN